MEHYPTSHGIIRKTAEPWVHYIAPGPRHPEQFSSTTFIVGLDDRDMWNTWVVKNWPDPLKTYLVVFTLNEDLRANREEPVSSTSIEVAFREIPT